MTGSHIFSVNFINRNNPAKPNCHMSIKKSQAKCTEYRTAGHLVFWKLWPAVELKNVLSVTKHGFVFWAQRKPNAILEIYKHFRIAWLFLIDMIIWSSWEVSILWNLLRIWDCWSFTVLKTLTGYRPYSHSVLKYVRQLAMFKWFWTIFSLGAPEFGLSNLSNLSNS